MGSREDSILCSDGEARALGVLCLRLHPRQRIARWKQVDRGISGVASIGASGSPAFPPRQYCPFAVHGEINHPAPRGWSAVIRANQRSCTHSKSQVRARSLQESPQNVRKKGSEMWHDATQAVCTCLFLAPVLQVTRVRKTL